jgi:RNase adaptor protein for sRNA GlmZ degradation
LKEDLRRQIAPVEAVIALSSLYDTNPDMVYFQLLYADANNIPVILLKRFGDQRPLHKMLIEHADEIIDWDERALVDAVRKHARHEDTTRWDTIEFKLD